MAEIYKSAGYKTAYLGKWHLDGHGRYNNVDQVRRQGFDFWKTLECSHNYNNMPYYENRDPEMKYWEGYSPFAVSKGAQDYLAEQANSTDPFLLFVSIATPHFPHHTALNEYKNMYPESELKLAANVPAELHEKVRKELSGYYAHCTATDKAIGDLINKAKELNLMENTIIVFTSDHGEMMGAHGVSPRTKQKVWDESIKIPFLISYPSIDDNRGAVVNAPITTPEILPSLLSLSGIEIPKSIEGEDISSLIKSPNPAADRMALVMNLCPFTGNYPDKEYRGIRTKQYTYVSSPEGPFMMFDNIKDPHQMNNILGNKEYKDVQKKLDRGLKRELKKIGDKNFKPRDYYLNKWNLKLNNGNSTCVDYAGFNKGKGVIQTPHIN
jgi:arylsulfatase A-like enzyme